MALRTTPQGQPNQALAALAGHAVASGRASLKHKMRLAVLSERIEVCGEDVDIFRITPKEGEVFSFKPGQYATLGLDIGGEFVARAYSISSSAYNRAYLELYINVIKDGAFTPALFALRPGDEIYYMGPKGVFTLAKTQARYLLFLATGTGLAPYVSMLRTMREDQLAGRPHGRTITLVHGVRFSIDLGYREELEALARDPEFGLVYLPAVSRVEQDPGWTSELGRGRITEILKLLGAEAAESPALPAGVRPAELSRRLPPEATAVFLCGNPDMIADSKAILAASGYSELYTEEYW
jgi:ferredoxin--NADP+ reductase